MEAVTLEALTFGLEPAVLELVARVLGKEAIRSIAKMDEFEKVIENPPSDPFSIIICGPDLEGIPPVELAQALKQTFANRPVFYAASNRGSMDRSAMKKNGFSDAFILPLDRDLVAKALEETRAMAKTARQYRPVQMVDIQAGTTLGFDTFIVLPANQKVLKYSAEGDPIDAERVERLKKNQVRSLYVDQKDLPKFFDYAAEQLKKLTSGGGEGMSETERRARLESSVRDLVMEMYNTDAKHATITAGKELSSNASEVCRKLVVRDPAADWWKEFEKTITEAGDDYGHMSSVATYAVLFGIGMGYKQPEEIAMAAMLHDIGLSSIPLEIVEKPEAERTKEEQALYMQHPKLSIEMIKKRKMILPTAVYEMVLQHHERWDGSGYPEKLFQAKISVGATILALADRFDYEARLRQGEARKTPIEILESFKNTQEFHPKFINELLTLIRGGAK